MNSVHFDEWKSINELTVWYFSNKFGCYSRNIYSTHDGHGVACLTLNSSSNLKTTFTLKYPHGGLIVTVVIALA